MKDQYLVLLIANNDEAQYTAEVEFYFDDLGESTNFIKTALEHGANVRATVEYFPKPED